MSKSIGQKSDSTTEMHCVLDLEKARDSRFGRVWDPLRRFLSGRLRRPPFLRVRYENRIVSGSGPSGDYWPCADASFQLRNETKISIPKTENEIRCFILCRNEGMRLPWLLSYYRRFGVDRFFVIDNGSTDESRDIMASQPDTHVFATTDKFSEHRHGTNWVQALLQLFGVGHWCLTVDADEVLVFPGSERIDLKSLSRFMDLEGSSALFAVMIDMYPVGLSASRSYRSGQSFFDTADHFDLGPYYVSVRRRHAFPPIKVRGGFQHRLLQQRDGRLKGPLLKKVPFVKWAPGHFYGASAHSLDPTVPLSPVTGALMHFKALAPESSKAPASREPIERSRQERKRISVLGEVMASPEGADFTDRTTTKYRDSLQLLEAGFLNCSHDFAAFVKEKSLSEPSFPDSRNLADRLENAAANPRGLAAILREHIL